MSFIHTALLAGLGAIAIPIILHLLNRRTAKTLDWGAMRFLLESIESRRRRIELEEALLMACRCLLFGLLALAVARPFSPPGSQIPWVAVLPAFLLGLVAVSSAVILRASRRMFWWLLLTGLALFAYCAASVMYERYLNQKRFGTTGKKDIAFIIDASTSMQLRSGKAGSNFELAVAEAREIVEKTGGGSAFSLVLGGPVPMPRIPVPVVNKNDIYEALADAAPVKGKMAAFDCLARAAESLSRGSNPNKEIIILTDGQNIGWDLENRARWDALMEGMSVAFDKRPPQVLFRRYSLPQTFRNAAVAGISFSREVIGMDRPVGIEVTLENTGTEAVTPSLLQVQIGEVKVEDRNIGQLAPGSRQIFRFPHQFKTPGNHVVTATLTAADDLPLDDTTSAVCHVVDKLGVLLVDGNPGTGVLAGSARFTAMALLPDKIGALMRDPGNAETRKNITINPEFMPASRVSTIPALSAYDVIILADVPKLPETFARRLASWVHAGGGLLVTPGGRAEPAFYNDWRDTDGTSVLPARLTDRITEKEGVNAALTTFTQLPLTRLADPKFSDLGGMLLHQYWRLDTGGTVTPGSFTAGRLGNGDAFLTGRRLGLGTVFLACTNLDTEAGSNLPGRRSFVPLVHEMVYHLSSPEGQPFNRAPAGQLNLPLNDVASEGGLKGEYFRQGNFDTPLAIRIDPARTGDKPPALEMSWGGSPAGGVPNDFSARWTGSLIPRYSEEYTFDGWADDEFDIYVNDKIVIDRGGEGKVRLQAGKPHRIRIDFTDGSGNASMQLQWRSQSQQREAIPAECLVPWVPGSEDSALGQMPVTGPDNLPRTGSLLFTRGGLAARLTGDIVPGLYRMQVPKDRLAEFKRFTAADGTIPFAVVEDAAESRMQPLLPAELDLMRQRLAMLEPRDAADIITILAGREFGEELWKYLAVAALFLLLLEIALTRWIALSRRSGEGEEVKFETRFDPSAQFQEQLRKAQSTGN